MSEIHVIKVSGEDAIDELNQMREQFPVTGEYPLLLGDDEDLEMIQEGIEDADDVETILEACQHITAEECFQRWLNAPERGLSLEAEEDWPDATETEMGLITHLDLNSGEPKEEVLIGGLKVQNSWEAFATLAWGGWNECPQPAEHCAVHRHWAEKYGAEVVSITGDVVQCIVTRPPETRAAALALAREQYAYSPDIVEQGTESLAALAAGLLNSEYWYFWWD